MSDDPPTTEENVLASLGMTMTALCGLLAYGLVISAVLKKRKTKFSNSFYTYIVSLGVSDCLMLCLFLFYSIPLTLLQRKPFGEHFDRITGILCGFGWYTALPCVIGIAINRWCAVCRWGSNGKWFCDRNVLITMVFFWSSGVVSIGCARLRYYFDIYTWAYDLDTCFTWHFIWFERIYVFTTCSVLIISYTLVIKTVRASAHKVAHTLNEKEQQKRQRTDYNIAMEFLGVAVYLVIFDLVFTILPEYTTNRWHLYISSIMYIINSSINPFIYIATSSEIRNEVKKLFGIFNSFAPSATGQQATSRHPRAH